MRIKRKLKRAKKVFGTTKRPRLAVFRSLNNIYAQIIDDEQGKTIAAANSLKMNSKKTDSAIEVGKVLAESAKSKGVTNVVFDRRKKRYHGRIKALADAVREGGLSF